MLLVVSFAFLYFRYFNPVNLSWNNGSVNEDFEQESAFSDFGGPYMSDSELGTVAGESALNEVAKEFLYVFHIPDYEVKITDYKRYSVQHVLDTEIDAIEQSDGNSARRFKLECDPSKTALFKDRDMSFVSSGFAVKDVLLTGDLIFSNCSTSGVCASNSIGPDCIIVRIVK
ncbi:MAG: hypothetical protein UV00_C0010G0010 [candidate division WWE3 bacterium GW2011_GWF1_42_14]|uniref:Uncharacterized protein n=1 Tax=candidate division WWE3 bacterium GW2011_GWF1_42_14 TaxID=1619138 RepID=A0A0G1BKD3_UNCKA|nr:MAG: hypothetical protein UU92_C0011G0009 [candidate division WWE3 bacterium GW2011_GWA1_42_12]KKS34461.1 MAG: hypothetical protein UU97_C0010G0008 [candidate division WWE3 bacterium GW2011_GWD1_42_14]KKS37938.1 MAG: hypothetical protein UV00_C0010G0010 [candidate division WWE3 bacterium GW2011_GWF1_42_14]KKS40245.1 MAG: hypothetical protein UV03_C0009G0008 [candidate division WWE3 bacterium GW2011_GWE1_42_16]